MQSHIFLFGCLYKCHNTKIGQSAYNPIYFYSQGDVIRLFLYLPKHKSRTIGMQYHIQGGPKISPITTYFFQGEGVLPRKSRFSKSFRSWMKFFWSFEILKIVQLQVLFLRTLKNALFFKKHHFVKNFLFSFGLSSVDLKTGAMIKIFRCLKHLLFQR